MKRIPRSESVRIFCWVAAFSSMAVFIAGAMSTGACVAITVVDSISSAIPQASFPIILAVAGAITNTSAR